MTTSTSNNTTTYTIVEAMFEKNKFEVIIKNFKDGFITRERYMTKLDGAIRVFSSRNGARKAIVRAIRASRGERGALHR